MNPFKSQQRAIDKSRRTIEREREKMERQRKKNLEEFKKMAQNGNQMGAKMMAKDIVRLQNQSNNVGKVSGQLKGLSMKVQNANSLNTMSNAIQNSAQAMNIVNQNLNINNLQNQGREMIKQNEKLNMKTDMINDVMDNLYDVNEDEIDELYQQVLREAGFNVAQQFPNSVNIYIEYGGIISITFTFFLRIFLYNSKICLLICIFSILINLSKKKYIISSFIFFKSTLT